MRSAFTPNFVQCATLLAVHSGKVAIDLSSVTTVGLNLAKHVFFIHAVDNEGKVLVAREVRRRDLLAFFAALPACRVGWKRAARHITGAANLRLWDTMSG